MYLKKSKRYARKRKPFANIYGFDFLTRMASPYSKKIKTLQINKYFIVVYP